MVQPVPAKDSSCGAVAFRQGLTVGYYDAQTIGARNAKRTLRRGMRRFTIGAVLVGVWITGANLIALQQRREQVRADLVKNFQTRIAAFSQNSEELQRQAVWPDFVPSDWRVYTGEITAAQADLVRLNSNPDSEEVQASIRTHLQNAHVACEKFGPDLRSFLQQKVMERCPRHPEAVRVPEYQACPYPPELHYRFPFWRDGHKYSWRDSSGHSKSLAINATDPRCLSEK